MPFAAAVKFKENGASKYFNPGGVDVRAEDFVWVKDPGTGGLERIGFVSCLEGRAPIQMGHLPKVMRLAEEAEVEAWYELKIEEREMIQLARERAAAHDLPVKISDLVYTPEKKQVLIQFTSDHRVDFRELVRDLAGHFKARIEMWQIGSRKEAGLKEGYGICGNPLCCGSWLKDFPSITMRYAKEQDIVQPPSKLSGPCGKLRCCLRYEHETYLELADGVATRGCTGCSSDGKCGVVVDRNLLKQELTLKTDEGSYVSVPVGDFEEDEKGRPRKRAEKTGAEAPTRRQEPRRWAPDEPPKEETGKTVEDLDEGGISATTGPAIAAPEAPPASGSAPRERGPRREGSPRRDRPSRPRPPRPTGEGDRPKRPSQSEAPEGRAASGERPAGKRAAGPAGGGEKSGSRGAEEGSPRRRRGRSRRAKRRGGPGGAGPAGESGGGGES